MQRVVLRVWESSWMWTCIHCPRAWYILWVYGISYLSCFAILLYFIAVVKSVSSPMMFSQDPVPTVKAISPSSTSDSASTCSPSSPNMVLWREADDVTGSPYSCGCGECQLEDFSTKVCSNPLRTDCSFPYVKTMGLSEGERERLILKLQQEFVCINRAYARFTYSLRRSLEKSNVSAECLADVLMDLRGCKPFTRSLKCPSLLEDRYDELSKAENISKAFVILRDYHSFFNYEIVAFVVEVLGTTEDQEKLALYQEKFAVYCKRHVFECPSYSGTSDKLASFTVKVNEQMTVGEPGIFTAESLLHFKSKLAEVFNVTKYALKLCSVEHGCLKMLFQTPRHILEVILSQVEGNQKHFHALGIQKLRYGGKEVYSASHPEAQIVTRKVRCIVCILRMCVWVCVCAWGVCGGGHQKVTSTENYLTSNKKSSFFATLPMDVTAVAVWVW